jgi:type I restriction enzyme M protein
VELKSLGETHSNYSIAELVKNGIIELSTGDEIGKSVYGTGDIPFVRTSDIFNWEIKSAPKQGVAKDVYNELDCCILTISLNRANLPVAHSTYQKG